VKPISPGAHDGASTAPSYSAPSWSETSVTGSPTESGKAAGMRAPALFASLVLASSCVAHSAEAGWHLRQPPVARQKELRANHPRAFIHITGAPVSRWYRIGVFDTVHECAAERERLLAEIHDHVRLRRDESPLWKSFNAASLSAMEASECIASDDPRSLME
jgi:hypothetical protein